MREEVFQDADGLAGTCKRDPVDNYSEHNHMQRRGIMSNR
jgi:hypothetical protein